jgi:hypothetical protein
MSEYVPYETLDRTKFDNANIATDIVKILRNNNHLDYGSKMRVLSKSLAVINADNKDVEKLLDPQEDCESSVSGGINTIVNILRKADLYYIDQVDVLTHVMGFISEEHRIGKELPVSQISVYDCT